MCPQGSIYERQTLIRDSKVKVFRARFHPRNVRKADVWKAYPISAQKTILCHKNLPRCHIKMAAKTDYTGKWSFPLSEQTGKSFGSILAANRTFGKECWRSSIFKLRHLCSKDGRFIWRSGNHYSTKHTSGRELCLDKVTRNT